MIIKITIVFFNEIKRVYLFYKKRYDILILVIVISFLLYNSFNSMHKINNTKKKGILKGGGEGDLSKYLLNTSILENLKEQFPLDKKINYVMVGFGYFMLAFVVRPIKGFFFFILIKSILIREIRIKIPCITRIK